MGVFVEVDKFYLPLKPPNQPISKGQGSAVIKHTNSLIPTELGIFKRLRPGQH